MSDSKTTLSAQADFTNRVFLGSCENMAEIPDGVVQTCVTSPPYWGLREYGGDDGMIGMEESIADHIGRLVRVFREVRRVLRPDGTLWVNYGDAYNAGTSAGRVPSKSADHGYWENGGSMGDRRVNAKGLKPKDLIGLPWRLALALQEDGWYLRCDIIWHKPNPMPESVTDRPSRAHEYLFLLSKSPRYYYDIEAIAEPCSPNTYARLSQNVASQIGSERANGGKKTNGNMKAVGRKKLAAAGSGTKANESFAAATMLQFENRNRRTVWTIATEAYREAHFATFPRELPALCIRAGSKIGDVVLDPFMGSGTTAEVAESLGRHWTGYEINPEYHELIRERVRQAGLFTA